MNFTSECKCLWKSIASPLQLILSKSHALLGLAQGRGFWKIVFNFPSIPGRNCRHAKSLQSVQLFAILWTVAHQRPLCMGFSGQEYWSAFHFHLEGIFWTEEMNPRLFCLLHWQAGSLPLVPPGTLRRNFRCYWWIQVENRQWSIVLIRNLFPNLSFLLFLSLFLSSSCICITGQFSLVLLLFFF